MTRKASKLKASELLKTNQALSLQELTTLKLTPLDSTYNSTTTITTEEPKVTSIQAITYIAPVITGLIPLAVIICLGPQSEERVDQLTTWYSSLSDKSISSIGLNYNSLQSSSSLIPPKDILSEALSGLHPILIISRFFLSSPAFTSAFYRSPFLRTNLKGIWIDGGQYCDSSSNLFDPITKILKPLRLNWTGKNIFNYGVDLGMNCPLSTREGGSEEEEDRVRRIIDCIDSDVTRERVAGSRTHAARNQAMPSPVVPGNGGVSASSRKGDVEEVKEELKGETKKKVTKEELDDLSKKFGMTSKV